MSATSCIISTLLSHMLRAAITMLLVSQTRSSRSTSCASTPLSSLQPACLQHYFREACEKPRMGEPGFPQQHVTLRAMQNFLRARVARNDNGSKQISPETYIHQCSTTIYRNQSLFINCAALLIPHQLRFCTEHARHTAASLPHLVVQDCHAQAPARQKLDYKHWVQL